MVELLVLQGPLSFKCWVLVSVPRWGPWFLDESMRGDGPIVTGHSVEACYHCISIIPNHTHSSGNQFTWEGYVTRIVATQGMPGQRTQGGDLTYKMETWHDFGSLTNTDLNHTISIWNNKNQYKNDNYTIYNCKINANLIIVQYKTVDIQNQKLATKTKMFKAYPTP